MTSAATKDEDMAVAVPAELARLAGIEPGIEIDVELTDAGLLVRPKAVADAEDAEDLAAAEVPSRSTRPREARSSPGATSRATRISRPPWPTPSGSCPARRL